MTVNTPVPSIRSIVSWSRTCRRSPGTTCAPPPSSARSTTSSRCSKKPKHSITIAFVNVIIMQGLAGISVQLAGSVMGLCLNLTLLLGALNRLAWALLAWLLCYSFAICGCILLFGVLLNKLMVRADFEFFYLQQTRGKKWPLGNSSLGPNGLKIILIVGSTRIFSKLSEIFSGSAKSRGRRPLLYAAPGRGPAPPRRHLSRAVAGKQ